MYTIIFSIMIQLTIGQIKIRRHTENMIPLLNMKMASVEPVSAIQWCY
jgi:hypothetical protein